MASKTKTIDTQHEIKAEGQSDENMMMSKMCTRNSVMMTTNNKEKEHKEQQQLETTTPEYKMPQGWKQTNKLLFLNRQMEYP